MKYRDIPQFTRVGSWEVDYDLEQFVIQIEKWQKEYGLEMNPDFQRGPVWTEEQQIRYLEFLLRGGKTARVIYLNCPWWQSEAKTAYKAFVCVDGLQRSIAITRFVNNEIKVFGAYSRDYEDRPRMNQGIKININQLQTRKEVLQYYIDFNTGGVVHTDEEINRVKALLALEE
ncbi:DUF262 domain-containing protein (plasmid) [Aneurinibacillus sp. Ricciae_BoGa-3]|uniref:DUF262 domain-containing protein n=1 Tax=Aneurinibacillus sp. Ricciae_BoGa-3 TaxID=3022697 RepID=UPI002341ABFC|nr:DUF262 domain-containing protein [Aneurinibacillus sp. Ricciae_BoGa-3]WCK57495.1 DUF262 domain-containing protein [Aneurinibacillus sp. Ricciae_BoGa-3]